ncbi:invasion associated locus B family protein [Falsirhodobacter halotolerans]|uniref:invasion associated locus B family protein n=1 Tax=Falsirhodobacter halotolerans TaxID=1146892 RepID=UPI001FD5051C|nr:invasion associated locus B family protein [Falsirhodobacter halotolerans]MCJ8139608.1 invasion associated locus B family protein [Falsirhodobacter halotolerans]
MSKTLSRILALALTFGVSHAAMAQDTPPAAPTGDSPATQGLSMGAAEADPNAPGAMRVAGTFGSWEQRCIREDADTERCQLYQLLKDGEGNNVAEFSLFNLPAGNEAAAGATIIVPLETLLTANLSVKVDSAQPRVYPFSWCSEIGCVARVGFTQGEVDALKRGSNAQLTIVPVVAPDQRVTLDMSLSGFTAGWDAVVAANAAE